MNIDCHVELCGHYYSAPHALLQHFDTGEPWPGGPGASGCSDLASAYQAAGALTRAVTLLERTLADRRRILGPEHPDTLSSMDSLAYSYADTGRPAEALALREEALKLRKVKLGPDHPDTLDSMSPNFTHSAAESSAPCGK